MTKLRHGQRVMVIGGGHAGYFPPIIRLRPVMDSVPPRYEAAEVINLQAVRESARMKRSHND